MSSGGGSATSARINPALRRIFFVPALFRPRLAYPRLPFHSEQADIPRLPPTLSPSPSVLFPRFHVGPLPGIKILQRAH